MVEKKLLYVSVYGCKFMFVESCKIPGKIKYAWADMGVNISAVKTYLYCYIAAQHLWKVWVPGIFGQGLPASRRVLHACTVSLLPY